MRAFVGSRVVPIKGAAPSEARDLTGNLSYASERAEAWCKARPPPRAAGYATGFLGQTSSASLHGP